MLQNPMNVRSQTPTQKNSAASGTLGTFAGVFTPSFLTIIGIIFFMRLGYVVGHAGLWRALIIIAVANAISIFTSISLSAIATNLKVKVGGVYYIISRTLGAEFGGAIGIVLYFAQSISIAFYCIGFGEVVAALFPGTPAWLPQTIAAVSIAALFVFAWLGADWATKFQYAVMAVLACSIVSFFIGGFSNWDPALLSQSLATQDSGLGFWVLFAIFFPAVTGFTQGVNMSGDLKDPGKSIPLGTFIAVGLSICIYLGAAVVSAASLPLETLMQDYGAMKRISLFGFLIDAGVIAAALSSAMASFLGGPRVLQSLASDRIIPFLLPLAKGYGPTNNPRRAVLLSALIAFATVGIGNLNVIAPVVSMFFLVSYGLLNFATYFEARAHSPSFRPQFRFFDQRLSLIGWIACFGVMMAIDPLAGVVSLAVLMAVYQYLKRTAGPSRWADTRRSFYLQQVRQSLLAAEKEPEHPRNWRPQILAFSDDTQRRERLLRFSSWIEGGSGLTTAVRILEGDGITMLKQRRDAEIDLSTDIAEHGLKAFPLVVTAPNIDIGVSTVIQSFGVGPLKVNTVLLNWMQQMSRGIPGIRELRYGRNLRNVFRLGCHIVILHAPEDRWNLLQNVPAKKRCLDVWWWDNASSRLMLLFAYLITRSPEWDEARIRVLAMPSNDGEQTSECIQQMLDETRIDAEFEIVSDSGADTIPLHSRDDSIVFFPFRLVGTQLVDPFGGKIEAILERLPVAALVLAAEDIDLAAEPEEGEYAETAAVHDEATDAAQKAQKAQKDALEKAQKSADKKRELQKAAGKITEVEKLNRIEKEAIDADNRAEVAARKAAKASVKAEAALQAAEKLNTAHRKDGK